MRKYISLILLSTKCSRNLPMINGLVFLFNRILLYHKMMLHILYQQFKKTKHLVQYKHAQVKEFIRLETK